MVWILRVLSYINNLQNLKFHIRRNTDFPHITIKLKEKGKAMGTSITDFIIEYQFSLLCLGYNVLVKDNRLDIIYTGRKKLEISKISAFINSVHDQS